MTSTAAYTSVLDLFSIGIGPSSSHTVGPMRAARQFRDALIDEGHMRSTTRIRCEIGGSLASTGVGHGTPAAILAGLDGFAPETCDPETVRSRWVEICASSAGGLLHGTEVIFAEADLAFRPLWREDGHPNPLRFEAIGLGGVIASRTYLSIGGGFIRVVGAEARVDDPAQPLVPFPIRNFDELLKHGDLARLSIGAIALANERALHPDRHRFEDALLSLWVAMDQCIERGMAMEGFLPGPLRVPRRAAAARKKLESIGDSASEQWISVYAMAVNEENAVGARVVTAPTNGAAGIVPAVLKDYARYREQLSFSEIRRYLLTATMVGHVVKANASISGAEVGCQGEVGSACAMAAAGLTALHGGTNRQIENAAEIALEHHLGLTCDPVGGLVQIPCIERNGIAAATARTASRMALLGDGRHSVSLDVAIETLRQTGADMSTRYKETSQAGLAVNVVEC